MRKRKKAMLVLAIFTAFIATTLFLPGLVSAGDLEPSAAPGPTMKTLDEIPPTWSQKLDSTDGDPVTGCNSSRFECVMGGEAVLDKETGLVWAKNANAGGIKTWFPAMEYCLNLSIANRKGWRLPTVEELASLIDTTQTSPALPSGHPFDNVRSYLYWSSTTVVGDSYCAWSVHMLDGHASLNIKNSDINYMWPVRGGN